MCDEGKQMEIVTKRPTIFLENGRVPTVVQSDQCHICSAKMHVRFHGDHRLQLCDLISGPGTLYVPSNQKSQESPPKKRLKQKEIWLKKKKNLYGGEKAIQRIQWRER